MPAAASHTTLPDALDALNEARRHGQHQVPVACGGCLYTGDDTLMLVDLNAAGVATPGNMPGDVVVIAHDGELDEDLSRCPGCLDDIEPQTVILRDRHQRVARALDERTRRGLDLHVALNHGDVKRAAAILGRAA